MPMSIITLVYIINTLIFMAIDERAPCRHGAYAIYGFCCHRAALYADIDDFAAMPYAMLPRPSRRRCLTLLPSLLYAAIDFPCAAMIAPLITILCHAIIVSFSIAFRLWLFADGFEADDHRLSCRHMREAPCCCNITFPPALSCHTPRLRFTHYFRNMLRHATLARRFDGYHHWELMLIICQSVIITAAHRLHLSMPPSIFAALINTVSCHHLLLFDADADVTPLLMSRHFSLRHARH